MPDWRDSMARGDLRHPRLRARVRERERLIGTFVKSRDPDAAEALALSMLTAAAQSTLGQLRTRS